jgi:hypothetical protein
VTGKAKRQGSCLLGKFETCLNRSSVGYGNENACVYGYGSGSGSVFGNGNGNGKKNAVGWKYCDYLDVDLAGRKGIGQKRVEFPGEFQGALIQLLLPKDGPTYASWSEDSIIVVVVHDV